MIAARMVQHVPELAPVERLATDRAIHPMAFDVRHIDRAGVEPVPIVLAYRHWCPCQYRSHRSAVPLSTMAQDRSTPAELLQNAVTRR